MVCSIIKLREIGVTQAASTVCSITHCFSALYVADGSRNLEPITVVGAHPGYHSLPDQDVGPVIQMLWTLYILSFISADKEGVLPCPLVKEKTRREKDPGL
ncbi:hypothetical protein AMECASPLE_029744 [Ameca splendens]|uniref:Uncharacterized protein n=1 Tax=Ameca splendens TaxID=208324 RepID=A0ABV0ZQQ3_9TELE